MPCAQKLYTGKQIVREMKFYSDAITGPVLIFSQQQHTRMYDGQQPKLPLLNLSGFPIKRKNGVICQNWGQSKIHDV